MFLPVGFIIRHITVPVSLPVILISLQPAVIIKTGLIGINYILPFAIEGLEVPCRQVGNEGLLAE
jgi:hypothetical protein